MKLPTLLTLATALGLGATTVLAASRAPTQSPEENPSAPSNAEDSRATVALRTPIRYAALGASDTVGSGSRVPARENWTARIHAALPENTVYERFARSGITLAQAVHAEVPLPTYQKSLQATLERLTRETDAQVVLLNVPDLAALAPPHASAQTRARLRETTSAWNAAIAAAARPHGPRVLVVDLVPASKQLPQHAEWISADGFHPSPEGYQKLADLALQEMHRAGLLPPARTR
jgi:hypothetical protein